MSDLYEDDEDPETIRATARPTYAVDAQFWFTYQDPAEADAVMERIADIVMDQSDALVCATLRAPQETVTDATQRIDAIAKIILRDLPANSQVVARAYETAEEIVATIRAWDNLADDA